MSQPPDAVQPPCTLYLLRHGATEHNLVDPPRIQGQGVDIGLSPEGRAQAECAARLLAPVPLAAIYSSPLVRACQTADIIAAPHQLLVQTVDELTEVDVGCWERRTWAEIARLEPEAYQRFQQDPATYGYRGGENLQQLVDRVLPAVERLAGRHSGQQIAIVAHSVVNRTLLGALLGLPLARARAIPQDNGAVNVLQYRDGRLKLVTANSVFHLLDHQTN